MQCCYCPAYYCSYISKPFAFWLERGTQTPRSGWRTITCSIQIALFFIWGMLEDTDSKVVCTEVSRPHDGLWDSHVVLILSKCGKSQSFHKQQRETCSVSLCKCVIFSLKSHLKSTEWSAGCTTWCSDQILTKHLKQVLMNSKYSNMPSVAVPISQPG